MSSLNYFPLSLLIYILVYTFYELPFPFTLFAVKKEKS